MKGFFTFTKKHISLSFFFVLCVCIVLFISHHLYIQSAFSYPHEDEHVYLWYATQTYDLLRHPSIQNIQQVAGLFTDRQPLYPLSVALFLFLFGDANIYLTALYVNYIFYAISIIALYFLAKEFVRPSSAFFAAFIFAFYGFPLYYIHTANTETTTTAFIVLSLLFLKKSKNFTKRKFIFYFALSFFLGCLTRWVVPIFVIGPFLSVMVTSFLSAYSKKQWKKYFLNLSLFFGVGIILPLALYYIPRFHYFALYVQSLRTNGASWISTIAGYTPDLSNTFSVHSAMYYINVLSQQTVFFFLLLVVGFLLSLIFWKKYNFSFLAFFIPYFVFTFLSVYKKDRFIVPIYPSMALLSVIALDLVKKKFFYFLLALAILVLGSLNFLGASWGRGPLGHQGLKDIVLPSFVPHPRRIYLTTVLWPPSKDTLQVDTIINAIDADWKHTSQKAMLLTTFSIEPQEVDNAFASILYYTGKYNRRRRIDFINLRSVQPNDYKEVCSRIDQADYILTNGSPFIADASYSVADTDRMVMVVNKALEKNGVGLPSTYKEVKSFYIPFYKHTLILYRKMHALQSDDWNDIRNIFIGSDPEESEIITNSCGVQ